MSVKDQCYSPKEGHPLTRALACNLSQWTPPEVMKVWRRSETGTWTSKEESVENFICHNGDLDSFEIAKVTHTLESLVCVCVCVRACVRVCL